MSRILKLPLPPKGPGIVLTGTPIESWLDVDWQWGPDGQAQLVAWVVSTPAPDVEPWESKVYVAVTGEDAPAAADYLGTAQLDTEEAVWEPPYVVHVYVERKNTLRTLGS